jgi:histone-lysine N-methyltransferase SETMAR
MLPLFLTLEFDNLQCLRRAIQNKRRGLFSSGVVLVHDSARPHTARQTTALLQHFPWDILDHPPYCPDLAPSDYHPFLHMKSFLAGKRFHSETAEVETTVNNWLQLQAVEVFDTGVQKLVTRYKCLDTAGDYVEKQCYELPN